MARRFWIRSFALAAGLAGAAGCFIEADEPPGWRAICSQDGDCVGDAERCLDGLCQIPCTAASFADDCPSDGNYTACFNGVCASACSVEDDACPDPQSCQSVEVPEEFAEFGLSDFAVCGIACSDARPCPEAELCIEGACVDPSGLTTGGMSGGETGTSDTTGGY